MWSALLQVVPQGSFLGPVLFNIFLNDLFFILKNSEISYFADDTTPHACDANLDELLMCLQHDTALTISWFESNYMKLNADKSHLTISGNKHGSLWIDIGNDEIWESSNVKLLGVNIDRDLKFNEHMLNICSKANKKLTILIRMLNT